MKPLSYNRLKRKGKGRYGFKARFCWIIPWTLYQEKFVLRRMKRTMVPRFLSDTDQAERIELRQETLKKVEKIGQPEEGRRKG